MSPRFKGYIQALGYQKDFGKVFYGLSSTQERSVGQGRQRGCAGEPRGPNINPGNGGQNGPNEPNAKY